MYTIANHRLGVLFSAPSSTNIAYSGLYGWSHVLYAQNDGRSGTGRTGTNEEANGNAAKSHGNAG